MSKETVTVKTKMENGREIEYFAHGASELEGSEIQLSFRTVYVSAMDMGFLNKLRELPIEDKLKILKVNTNALIRVLDLKQKQLNAALHKVVIKKLYAHETGELIDKKFMFMEWGWHSYANTIRNLKKGSFHIDLINKLIDNLCEDSIYALEDGEPIFMEELIRDAKNEVESFKDKLLP